MVIYKIIMKLIMLIAMAQRKKNLLILGEIGEMIRSNGQLMVPCFLNGQFFNFTNR